jgi:hypothetical protein
MRSGRDRTLRELVVSYALGGATFVFVVGLFAGIFFDGEWDTHNKWKNKQYGTRRILHAIAGVVIAFALFSVLCIIVAVVFNVAFPHLKRVEFVLWICGFVFFFIAAMAEAAGINYTRYGDALVPTLNDFEKDKDFRTYIDKYGRDSEWHQWTGLNSGYPFPLPGLAVWIGQATELNVTRLTSVLTPLDWTAYVQRYARGNEDGGFDLAYVTGCAFNWSKMATKFNGYDPCNYKFEDGDAEDCIGGRSGSDYGDSLSDTSTAQDETAKFTADHQDDPAAIEHRAALTQRRLETIDSLENFYQNNSLVLGLQVVAFVVAVIGVFLDMKWRGAGPAAGGEPKKKP